MPNTSPRQTLADSLLGRPLAEYVREKRTARPRWSWTLIAEQLATDTDGAVAVSDETIRLWFPESAA